jgi:hypothetical protein
VVTGSISQGVPTSEFELKRKQRFFGLTVIISAIPSARRRRRKAFGEVTPKWKASPVLGFNAALTTPTASG